MADGSWVFRGEPSGATVYRSGTGTTTPPENVKTDAIEAKHSEGAPVGDVDGDVKWTGHDHRMFGSAAARVWGTGTQPN